VHVGNAIAWSQVRCRIAMTVQAELHGQWPGLVGERHRVHAAMTAHASDALGDVDVVAEIDVVRQPRDPMPRQRIVLCQTLAYRGEHGCAGPNLRMAGHAGVSGRQTRAGTGRDGAVAIAAIDTEAAGVMTM